MNAVQLAKYHARAPRYILNTDDDSLIRVAGPFQLPWEEGTEIKDISLTGLSFTAPDDLSPILGEVIKIQFTIPGSGMMACHGIVTRVEAIKNKAFNLVALHFYKMEMSQRIFLAQGLARKARDSEARKNLEQVIFESSQHTPLKKWRKRDLFVFISSFLLWGVVLFYYFRGSL